MKGDRRIKLGLVAGLALALVMLMGVPAAAETPSPTAGTPATAPPATQAPCPNPTATATVPPTPSPTPDPNATPTPGGQTPSPSPKPEPTKHPNLCPAVPGVDPASTIAWLFTPIFQAIFLTLVFIYGLVRDIGIAIIIVTLLIRVLLIPIFRRQIVSQRRMQAMQPELGRCRRSTRATRRSCASRRSSCRVSAA